jgi:hypothetical protein
VRGHDGFEQRVEVEIDGVTPARNNRDILGNSVDHFLEQRKGKVLYNPELRQSNEKARPVDEDIGEAAQRKYSVLCRPERCLFLSDLPGLPLISVVTHFTFCHGPAVATCQVTPTNSCCCRNV